MLIQPLTPEIIEKRRRFGRKILGIPGRVWRRTRRGLAWTLAFAFVAHCALNIYASVLLNRELAAIRSKGEPLQFSELAPPAVPDSQNAALVYAEATKSLRFSREDEVAVSTRQNERTLQQKQLIEAILRRNQRAIDLAQRAGLMPKCRFALDYQTEKPMFLLLPHYGELRRLARFVGARAEMNAEKGDADAAFRDVRAVFGMAHHLRSEPILIGFLVAQAIDNIANQALAEVLEAMPVTLVQADAFRKSLPKTDWDRAFFRCLTGERALGIVTFESSRQINGLSIAQINGLAGGEEQPNGESDTTSWKIFPLVLLWRPVSKLDEVQTLRLWKQVLNLSPTSQFQNSKKLVNPISQSLNGVPSYAVLTRVLFPVFIGAGDNRDRAEVRRRQREIALELAIYRQSEGFPAESFEEMSGAVRDNAALFDPYSKKPMIYRLDKDGKGFTLYSVGPNRKDDGGKRESFPNINAGADDIVWGAPKRSAP